GGCRISKSKVDGGGASVAPPVEDGLCGLCDGCDGAGDGVGVGSGAVAWSNSCRSVMVLPPPPSAGCVLMVAPGPYRGLYGNAQLSRGRCECGPLVRGPCARPCRGRLRN